MIYQKLQIKDVSYVEFSQPSHLNSDHHTLMPDTALLHASSNSDGFM